MKRKQWTTNFREDLRKGVNVLAAEWGVKPNHILEIGYILLNLKVNHPTDEVTKEQIEEILKEYKEGK